jgi:hypothetical protein
LFLRSVSRAKHEDLNEQPNSLSQLFELALVRFILLKKVPVCRLDLLDMCYSWFSSAWFPGILDMRFENPDSPLSRRFDLDAR